MLFIINDEIFVKESLNLNLFFLRVLKEHALFLAAGLPEKNKDLINEAKKLANDTSDLLAKTVELARGVINIRDDHITDKTLEAEKVTAFLSGLEIKTEITVAQMAIKEKANKKEITPSLVSSVELLNQRALNATKKSIKFKTLVAEGVKTCKIFSNNYPTLLHHVREEALLYYDILTKLQNRQDLKTIEEELNAVAFWNHIMKEHAEFIRGFLDPSEKTFIELANNFANQYEQITLRTYKSFKNLSVFSTVNQESLELTKKLQQFKKQATDGILNCKIKSIIIPLLADHVTREANHYLHLLTH